MNFRFFSTSFGVEAGIAAALIFFGASEAFAQSDGAQPAPNPTPPAATSVAVETPPSVQSTPALGQPSGPAAAASPTSATRSDSTIRSCSLEEIAAVQQQAPKFLVEVHAREGSTATTGIVIDGQRVLVPYVDVLKKGWPITVYFHDGSSSSAKILHSFDAENLAVLSLDSPPAGLVPHSFVQSNAPMGAPLISVGKPIHDGKNVVWEMRSAYVTGVLGNQLRASIESPPGAPLLNCSGEIVGVQPRKAYDESPDPAALSGAALAKVLAKPAKRTPTGYLAYGILDPLVVIALRQSDTGLGARMTFFEMGFSPRFFLRTNLSAMWLTTPELPHYATATDVSRWRFQFEAVTGLNQRFQFGSPAEGFLHFDLSPYLGLAARSDFTSLRRLQPDMTTTLVKTEDQFLDPLIGLRLQLPQVVNFRAMYQFQLDIKAPKQSIHTLGLGVNF